jgi:predicted dehydrogenase
MTIRLGFLGGGFIARHHAGMVRLGQVEASIAAVHDPDRQKAERFAALCDAHVVDTEEGVLDAVDAVFVCSWTAEHPRLVGAAAERGLPVFCEKPLATDLAGALEMVDTVARAGIVNQVGLVMRDFPGFLAVRHLLARPGVGRPMAVVFRDDQYLPTQGMYDSTWRADPAKAGAGVLLEHSIHDLDILEWLFGPIVAVNARSAEFHDLAGIEDSIVVSLSFESGLLATLTSVWHDVLERPSMRHVEVFTERSYCVLAGDVFGPVRWTGPEGDAGQLADEGIVSYLEAAGVESRNPSAAFVQSVLAGEPAHPSFESALRAHVVADAVYRSCRSDGATVVIAPGVPPRGLSA